MSLLESVLESPFQSYGVVELYPSIQAKVYGTGTRGSIIKTGGAACSKK